MAFLKCGINNNLKKDIKIKVRAEGGKRWCRTTISVQEGTITYNGVTYTPGQSIVIEASNPPSVQEDIAVDAGWRDMVVSK